MMTMYSGFIVMSSRRNDKVKKFYFLNMKFAFLEFSIKIMIKKILKNLMNILNIFFMNIINVNKNIIQIDDTEFVKKFV